MLWTTSLLWPNTPLVPTVPAVIPYVVPDISLFFVDPTTCIIVLVDPAVPYVVLNILLLDMFEFGII
jgi:hypothetical protein